MALISIKNVSKIYGPPKVLNSLNHNTDHAAEINRQIVLDRLGNQNNGFNPDSLTFALENVSLTIDKGEFVAIMGPSGSGKSTLMHIIGLLDKPTTGSYQLGKRDIGSLNDKALAQLRRNSIGFVFQSFNLLPKLSALDNVALPMAYAGVAHGQRLRRAGRILNAVGLGERLKHRPNQLSGGQMQRVAVGRALANNPSVLLADEPTGNLDTKTGEAVMQLLSKLHTKGKTVIVVTHDERIAKHAKRIIRIKDGRIQGDKSG